MQSIVMYLNCLKRIKYISVINEHKLFLCKRYSRHFNPLDLVKDLNPSKRGEKINPLDPVQEFNPLDPVREFNPFKRRKKRLVSIETDSRIASRICITVIGNGGIGQPRCIGLFTDFKGYLFNCGEGVGRFCREYDINMCAIKHFFVTQKKWENLSGIGDILLTNQVYGVSQLSLHGPPGVEYFESILAAEKIFPTEIRVRDPSKNLYIDHTLQVQYVPIFPKNNDSIRPDKSNVVFSYICKVFEKPGDFLVEKCAEYGVNLAPDLLKLKNGEDIVLKSGEIVHSKDVHTEAYPGTVILVVDCPSENFLDSFINEKKLEEYQLPVSSSLEASMIFHFTPSRIFSSDKYQDWVKRFHQDTQHFVLNSDNPTASSVAIHKTHKYFNMMHPEIFRQLKEVKNCFNFVSPLGPNIFHPPPMLQMHIRPEKKQIWSNVVDFDNGNEEDGTEAAKESPEFYDKLNQLKSILNEKTFNANNEIYPEVVFLGTSSSTSSPYRNVSAILVNTSPRMSILLDCGEGAIMQLTRYAGVDIYSTLRKISCVFISHKHTDHYMGLFHLVTERVKAFKHLRTPYEPLLLVLPNEIYDKYKGFCDIFEDISRIVKIFTCGYLGKIRPNKLDPYLGDIELLTVPVKHCIDAHGVVLQQGSKWKIAYSGDSAPSQKLIDAGKDCTLLIHEASIEDGLLNEALLKKHSTPSQAIDVAEKMNAKYAVTTHFSKRYLPFPVLPVCNKRHMAHAFDFMKVRMCDWPLIPHFTPVMQSLFQEQLQMHTGKTCSTENLEKSFFSRLKTV